MRRARTLLGSILLAGVALATSVWFPASAATSDPTEPQVAFPDLIPNTGEILVMPTFTWDEASQTWVESPPHLWFDTHAENHGAVALDLLVDDLQHAATSTVSQCVAWTSYLCRDRRQIGGFAWHEEHGHFHYQDFASYALRRVGADGRPRYSPGGLVVGSDKVSFCLVDSTPFTTPPTVSTYPGLCTATRQGISPGWADVYSWDLEGQQFSLEGLSDGLYALVITLDPAGRIYESDDANNVVEVTLELSNDRSEVRVVDKRWP